jgi:hypothetical protein
MRSIKSVLVVLIVGLALVAYGNIPEVAGAVGPMCWAGFCPDMSKVDANSLRDADRAPGHFPTGTPYPCIASPAYTDYINARGVPCPAGK